jgi:undecaprenyl-diphosphatase
MLNTKKIIYKVMIILLIIGIAVSLVNFGYHNYFDIFGAIFFGTILIYIYLFAIKHNACYVNYILTILGTFCICYIAFMYKLERHAWMAYYALIGVVASKGIFEKEYILNTLKNKITATIFCFAVIFIMQLLLAKISKLPIFVQELRWFVIGFAIPFSLHIQYLSKLTYTKVRNKLK